MLIERAFEALRLVQGRTSRLMYIVTPGGSPGGENGKIGVGKWPRRSFFAGGLRSALAHAGAANGTVRSMFVVRVCFSRL